LVPVSSTNRTSSYKGRISRANKWFLGNVPFENVVDRHGNKPVDILDTSEKPSLGLEFSDSLQNNEIILQFLTFTPLLPSSRVTFSSSQGNSNISKVLLM
jgi:hypothetical protein